MAEWRSARRAGQAGPHHALEDEQHGRSRHVAALAQHLALSGGLAPIHTPRRFPTGRSWRTGIRRTASSSSAAGKMAVAEARPRFRRRKSSRARPCSARRWRRRRPGNSGRQRASRRAPGYCGLERPRSCRCQRMASGDLRERGGAQIAASSLTFRMSSSMALHGLGGGVAHAQTLRAVGRGSSMRSKFVACVDQGVARYLVYAPPELLCDDSRSREAQSS